MAGRKNKPLTCTFYVGGKRVDKLTPEQCEVVAQRFAEAASRYYTQHPEEYAKLDFPTVPDDAEINSGT
jgi:hypothetical protein